ncbi:hypothetical protein GCM10009605_43020 [Nocardiopsis composta]
MLTPWSESRDTKVWRSSRAVHSFWSSPAFLMMMRKVPQDVVVVQRCPVPGAEHEVVVLPQLDGHETLPGLLAFGRTRLM